MRCTAHILFDFPFQQLQPESAPERARFLNEIILIAKVRNDRDRPFPGYLHGHVIQKHGRSGRCENAVRLLLVQPRAKLSGIPPGTFPHQITREHDRGSFVFGISVKLLVAGTFKHLALRGVRLDPRTLNPEPDIGAQHILIRDPEKGAARVHVRNRRINIELAYLVAGKGTQQGRKGLAHAFIGR